MSPQPVNEVIRKRTSWRTYSGEKLSQNDRQTILSYISSDLEPLFGSDLRFKLVDYDSGTQKLGTYGVIKDARHFIAGGVKPGVLNIEDYGYAMEKIILYATGMGLGTCWLGGFFNRQNFYSAFNLGEGEVMPAVTPIGYTKNKRGTLGKVVRFAAGSRNRKPWSELFFTPDFSPLTPEHAGLFAEPLELVRLGPSASNGQPWRVIVDGSSVHFYAKTRNSYESMTRLDIGIAFCHFDLSMNDMDVSGEWVVKDPGFPSRGLRYVSSWRHG